MRVRRGAGTAVGAEFSSAMIDTGVEGGTVIGTNSAAQGDRAGTEFSSADTCVGGGTVIGTNSAAHGDRAWRMLRPTSSSNACVGARVLRRSTQSRPPKKP